jgi:hypothetical protein
MPPRSVATLLGQPGQGSDGLAEGRPDAHVEADGEGDQDHGQQRQRDRGNPHDGCGEGRHGRGHHQGQTQGGRLCHLVPERSPQSRVLTACARGGGKGAFEGKPDQAHPDEGERHENTEVESSAAWPTTIGARRCCCGPATARAIPRSGRCVYACADAGSERGVACRTGAPTAGHSRRAGSRRWATEPRAVDGMRTDATDQRSWRPGPAVRWEANSDCTCQHEDEDGCQRHGLPHARTVC